MYSHLMMMMMMMIKSAKSLRFLTVLPDVLHSILEGVVAIAFFYMDNNWDGDLDSNPSNLNNNKMDNRKKTEN